MFRLDRALEAYRRAGSLNDRINLFGFIDDSVFLSKSGDVGVILAIKGVDHAGLAATEIDNYTKRLESAFKIFAEKCRVYQYLFKRSGETVSPQTYETQCRHPQPRRFPQQQGPRPLFARHLLRGGNGSYCNSPIPGFGVSIPKSCLGRE